MEKQIKSILITGVAGLLGSRLAEYIVNDMPHITVVGVDNLSGGYRSNVHEKVIFRQVDIGDTESMEYLFNKHKFDIVYHFGAYAAEALSPFIRKFNYINNLVATANVVNLCIKYNIGRLVFTSSMAVYGHGILPFNESAPRNPIDPYGVAKSACEMDIEIAGDQHGLDYCIIRPHNVYGYNQCIWDSYRNFIGIAMYKSLVGDPITVYGDGLQTRAFSEMSDILLPLWNAGVSSRASRQIINLGGTKESTILETATIVSKLSGAKIIHLPPRHEVRHAYSTHEKSENILGYKHTTSLHDGIANMWEWAQRQPKRERFIWSQYELEKGVYDYWKPDALKDGAIKTDEQIIANIAEWTRDFVANQKQLEPDEAKILYNNISKLYLK